MSTFIQRYRTSGPGIGVAVKDLIDLAGWPASAGCKAAGRRRGTSQAAGALMGEKATT